MNLTPCQTSADRGQRNSGVEMDQLPYWVVAVWFCGLIFFAARALNYTRLILNNLVPGKNYWDTASHVADHSILHTRFRIDAVSIDPALLTDLGQQYQKKGIRNNRIMFAWALGGFLLIGSLFSYLKA